MPPKKPTTKKEDLVASQEPEVKVIKTPETFLPIMNSDKYDLTVAVKQDYVMRFVPVLEKFIELEEEFKAIDLKNPTKANIEAAKKLRTRYVREVRGLNKTTKDSAKKDALTVSNFIQEVYNDLDEKSESKEAILSEFEETQKRKDQEEREALISKRKGLLEPYGVDTEFVDLAGMPETSFTRMLDNAKSTFELKQKSDNELKEQQEATARNEAKFGERVQRLLQLGLVFDFESTYALGDLKVSITAVKADSDEDFNLTIQSLYKEVTALNELKERRNTRVSKLRAAGLTQEGDDFILRTGDDVFLVEGAVIDNEPDEVYNDFVKPALDAKSKADELAENNRIILARINQVLNMGLQIDAGEDFHGFGIREASRPVLLLKDAEFNKWLETTRKAILKKREADEKIATDNKRIADEKKAADDKKIADDKAARLAPDKVKLRTLYDTLGAVAMPDMADEGAKKVIVNVQGLINKIRSYMVEEGKKL